MDFLIVIGIAAIALLLTGLTDLRALSRPFGPKTGRVEKHPDRSCPSESKFEPSGPSERHISGREN